MAIALGVVKQTRFKRQSAKGTIAGTTLGQIIRRETSTFELAKETYNTESEITSTQQVLSSRHGTKTVNGSIAGILSPLTYDDMMSAVLRRDFTAVTAISGVSVTIAGAGPTYTVTRAAGDFLAGGIKIGQVVRLTVGSLNAANINKNLHVLGVTATVLTVQPVNGAAMVAEGPIASTTVTVSGKVTYTPTSGHTNVYYTVEEWYADVPYSERNTDVKIASASLSLPGSGNAQISLEAVGLDQTGSASVYFTSPTAETTSGALVAASGVLFVNGVQQASVTDLSIEINGNEQPADGTVGSNLRADIFRGKVMVSGSFTAYFDSSTIPDLFRNETVTSLSAVFTTGLEANADFIAVSIPRLDLNTSSPDDGETGLKRTYSFVAEYNAAGGAALATEQTTLYLQDSLA